MIESRDLNAELDELKQKYGARDGRMGKIKLARTPGGLQQVYPEMFPNEGPYTDAMVANMVDVAAKDTAEVLAPMPSLTCATSGNASDRAREFHDKRTKIAYGYTDAANLGVELFGMADQYVTYSFAVGVVRPDFDRKLPIIQFIDPTGCYPVFDQWKRTVRLYQTLSLSQREARLKFPELGARLERDHGPYGKGRVEITRVYTDHGDYLICPQYPDMTLMSSPNPIGECLVHTFLRPGLSDEIIGAYDDVLAVQVAKARFALLTLEAATKAVQAPLVLPIDIQEINLGPDATLRTATPDKVRRVELNVPQGAFMQQAQLDNELRQGSRYPEVRTGNSDASIITGRGVQALGAGFDSQIKAAQTVLAYGIQNLISKCFKVDEALWPDENKTLRGNSNGTPYEVKYRPSKDINGNHSIDVRYGLMAGLQANQALVFGLQARGDKLISRRFLRGELPISFDPSEEESRVDVEDLRDGLKEAFAAMAMAIPQMAQAGQPPTSVLTQMAKVIKARQKGVPIEEAISETFEPEEEPAAPAAPPQMGMMGEAPMDPGMDQGMGGAPMAGAGAQMPSDGMRPDLMQMIAGLTGGGKPAMGASVIRRQAL